MYAIRSYYDIDYSFNATDDCGNAADEVVIRVLRHYDMTAPVSYNFV